MLAFSHIMLFKESSTFCMLMDSVKLHMFTLVWAILTELQGHQASDSSKLNCVFFSSSVQTVYDLQLA